MGCDIHLYVERKDKSGRWWKCTNGFKSDYYDENSDYFNDSKYKDGDSPYHGRHYDLFSYLADVRNGYGFAGCDTGDSIKPMSMPKGIPKDVSLSIKEESDSWGSDGHSHSYFTLKELKEGFEEAKKQTKIHRGWVNCEEYKDFKEKGKPESWCGSVSGSCISHVSNEEMDELIRLGKCSKDIYTKIEWKEGLGEELGYFFEHIIPQMENWGYEKHDEEEIRIVFWFDN